jgi:SAM-dependent methyltransferase
MTFSVPEQNTRPSLDILNALQEYDEFMESIGTLVDIGCGSGADIEWWATRTTREEVPKPLDIKCTGVDQIDQLFAPRKHKNVLYQRTDFEKTITIPGDKKFDVLWCHDAFQYCINPIGTLANWRNITDNGGMLVIAVPSTIKVHHRHLAFTQPSGCYYHHTMVSLIHMLALTGWDCRGGFFLQRPNDPWIRAIVYKSEQEPLDPKTASWHQLSELNLLPESAVESVNAHNYLRQQDLILPWLDHSLTWMGQL